MTAKPSFQRTYKRADGEMVADYGWVTDLEFFEEDWYPVELVEETWERKSVRRFWMLPISLGSCEVCEEDASRWWRDRDGTWKQVCEAHGHDDV